MAVGARPAPRGHGHGSSGRVGGPEVSLPQGLLGGGARAACPTAGCPEAVGWAFLLTGWEGSLGTPPPQIPSLAPGRGDHRVGVRGARLSWSSPGCWRGVGQAGSQIIPVLLGQGCSEDLPWPMLEGRGARWSLPHPRQQKKVEGGTPGGSHRLGIPLSHWGVRETRTGSLSWSLSGKTAPHHHRGHREGADEWLERPSSPRGHREGAVEWLERPSSPQGS